jgi:S1-C subfamily serine protease
MRHGVQPIAILVPLVLATAVGATAQLPDWPWLGVSITDITSGNVDGYSGGGGGAYITGVDTPGPAASAGLHRHDIIVGLNGHATLNTRELTCLLQSKRPGETVEVMFTRGGRGRTATVTLGSWPGSSDFPRPASAACGAAPMSGPISSKGTG